MACFINCFQQKHIILTDWGRVTHKCVGKLAVIGSEDGLSPGQRQAIIQTNDGILLIEPLGTNSSEIWSEIHTFWLKKMHLKMSSAKWRPFCLGLNVLIEINDKFSVNSSLSTKWPLYTRRHFRTHFPNEKNLQIISFSNLTEMRGSDVFVNVLATRNLRRHDVAATTLRRIVIDTHTGLNEMADIRETTI